MSRLLSPVAFFIVIAGIAISVRADESAPFQQPAISVPEGYTVELAAAPPLVTHPIMAGYDERGRLYVAETAGQNMQRAELEEKLPNFVTRLEDTDGDGKFDKRTTFADKLTFPQGALWHDGWLYVASSGAIWRFADKDDDGIAEVREKIVSSFGYTGNAADVHGCFLGPEGRIYWCEGRHGHEITNSAGQVISKGKAARIFSARSNGSDVQVHCGGGMDNPVEIDWTDEGEMLGTVNIFYHQRGDCLVHWMHGGVYPRHDQPQVLAEFKKTGEPLDAVHDYGHVAVSGCCRLRGAGDSPALEFLVTEFNTHKVVRTQLHRDGSTFRAEVTDFLQAASDDFHPTDVLEDADGSLLVIDTGGWFRIGCPTSQIAKPNIKGAIYRIRRTDAKSNDDPRGLAIDWPKLEAAPLINLLADSRPAVRERAIQTLARQGDAAVPYLSRALANKDATIRRNAVWTLTRIGTPKAQGSVRLLGLADKDPSVLAAAVYSAGATADASAAEDLQQLLTTADTPPQLRREAVTALGKIGEADVVPTILESLRKDTDRVLEHSLIYALIEIADPAAIAKGLADDSLAVRRAALIALDQMEGGNLTRDQVAALLDTTDQPLLAATLDVISRHSGWTEELVALARQLLQKPNLSEAEQVSVSSALVAFSKNEKVQSLIGEELVRSGASETSAALLLDVIQRSGLAPPTWKQGILALASGDNQSLAQLAFGVAGSLQLRELDEPLREVVRDTRRPLPTRVAALATYIGRMQRVEDTDFSLLLKALKDEAPPEARLAATRAIRDATLNDQQLLQLVDRIAAANAVEAAALLAPFTNTTHVEVLKKLGSIILKSPAEGAIPDVLAARLVDYIPDLSREERREILNAVDEETTTKKRRLALIQSELPTGGIPTGKLVFFGRKAACSSCHRVGSEGGKIGPDLSKVGERRNERDLLEAVVFPSASIARGFESHAILTADGVNLTGLVVRETPESLFVRTNDQREIRLKRSEIEAQKPSTISIMPAGLENTMSRQELADLLAFLRSLK